MTWRPATTSLAKVKEGVEGAAVLALLGWGHGGWAAHSRLRSPALAA